VQITTFNISLVVHGTIAENMDYAKVIKLCFYLNMHILAQNNCQLCMYQEDSNPYAVPMAMGIYHRLESPLDITTSTIIRRIVANHEAYQVTNVIKWLWAFCMQHVDISTVHILSYIHVI
jgi:ethanolamine-phosphate cytidylyltransferase